jgi:predicted aldo/keto reductase-like oxidoreductase
MERRQFLKKCFVGGATLSILPYLNCQKAGKSILAKRKLGRTGEMLSIIGFGGIVVRDVEQKKANDAVARAVERGINYFDVAPSYGNAEEILGPALKPYRKNSFLACKTQERKKDGAEKELHESLNKLETDYLDLYQLHAISNVGDVETALGSGGVMEFILKAKQEGKIRYVGFSAHSEEAALLAMENFDFDSILYPINFVCWYEGNFGPSVVAKAKEKNMGILALKAMAHTNITEGQVKPYDKLWYIPIEDPATARLALCFTLSQGTTAAIPPGEEKFFWQALDIAEKYQSLTEAELEQLSHIATGIKPLFSNI